MNCNDVKLRLIESLYGELSPEDEADFREHLAGCDGCRREMAGLEQSRGQLERLREPHVRLDLGRLYRAAADRALKGRRRWRRLAIAACAAAVLIGAFAATRLRVEWRSGQVTVSWGAGPSTTQAVAPRATDASPAIPSQCEERLAALEEIARLLSAELSRNDARHAAAMADMRRELARWQRNFEELTLQSSQRWQVAEEDIKALYYLTQFSPDSNEEGVIQ